MTTDITIVLSIIFVAVVLFIWERFSVDTVSILVMIALMAAGILTPEEGFAGFNNPATLTVGAMFVISAAVFKSGIMNNVSQILTKAGRTNFTLCLLFIMLISGSISAFINDTAVVALLMPVVIQVAKDANISPSKLLMPLSFGALLGGVCTLIGTSTNILVSGIAEKQGLPPFSMFEMTPAGLCFLAAGTIYILVAGQFLLPSRKANLDPADDFEMGKYLAEIILLTNSKSAGKTIEACPLTKDFDIEILQVTRDDGVVEFPRPNTMLRAGDLLKVRCNIDRLKQLAVREGIQVKGDTLHEAAKNLALYETLVTPDSEFIDHSLAELQFKQTYTGASVLAIRSHGNIIHEKIAHTQLKSGDILLLRSDKQAIHLLSQSKNLLILNEFEQKKTNLKKVIATLAIVFAAMAVAAVGIMPIVLSAAIGVILLIILGILKPEEAYQAIEWKVIFMLAGVLSMGAALEKTGAANLLGQGINDTIGSYGPLAVLSAFFIITSLLTNIMSNNATAALLAPIAIVTAEGMGISSRPLLMAVVFAASMSFMTPIGYQTNTMIYGPGNYKFKDYLLVGTPLNILVWLLAMFLLPKMFPF
ncbi:MAG: SLC13 family permease [Saprospiraceae bacterium]